MIARPSRPWESHYNGFSWAERRAVNPIQNALFRSGQLARPTTCSICGHHEPCRLGTSGYIFAHLEDYRQPAAIFPACRRCHAALHARFRDPKRWHRILRVYGRPGEWFVALSLDPGSQWRPFNQTYPNGLTLLPEGPAIRAREQMRLPL